MSTPTVKQEQLQALYRSMVVIRRAEEECARAYAHGKIGGFLHLYIGQEAIAVGATAALQPEDYVVTTYRDHGLALAKGMPLRTFFAELLGKVTGCSKGLGGSMHLFDREHNMLGGYGIVGGHIPLATGIAFASKYQNDKRVTLCFFGDGAVSIAGFHEGISLAALWRLPIVFICENNEYSMGTPLSRTLSVEDITLKASGYGIPHDRFFSDDVLEVQKRISPAVERARNESMPTLIEIRTYRYRGHSMSDPGKYRTPEEVEERKKRDPIAHARTSLLKQGVTEQALKQMEREIEEEIAEGLRFAEESHEPDVSILGPTTYDGPFAF
ncbi:pyruvate dehydrogenase (acetyl-transferring) E1 component subunit alpha [Pajaroellobacter abortibovis]|uniref:Pyruvate dehydrogenase E1 component subunit alpha n=1 Tax=Pajaroellobacter abortibovis TaxID=1882918 RepID=A0A1L6MX90_9BACT|nr:pyruvate dehydrogenase (acetyl-transferring) E1 component subunit alpha [Pajaroellobacter abortibovis]